MSQVNHSPTFWLLLVHRLPPKPDYLRVKVKRRLDRIGALAIKNSVYVLPDRPESTEDFQWLALEIQRDGGEALITLSSFIGGMTDAEVVDRFNADRDEAYRSIHETAHSALREPTGGDAAADPDWREAVQSLYGRSHRRLEETIRIDFFSARERPRAEEAVKALHSLLLIKSGDAGDKAETPAASSGSSAASTTRPSGATWVTRSGVFVDRIGSAWLIRKFIDPEAVFKFVAEPRYRGAQGELRFDMVSAEFTHEGDKCTFEVLAERFNVSDEGVRSIGEVVHDIDMKDEKFSRSEAAGVEAVLAGVVNRISDDEARLAAAFPLFDALYDRFRDSQSLPRPA